MASPPRAVLDYRLVSKQCRLRHLGAVAVAVASLVIAWPAAAATAAPESAAGGVEHSPAGEATVEAAGIPSGWSDVDATGRSVRKIVFPVDGPNSYTDTWLAPRGSRRHLGVDIMADKLTPVLAARAACVSTLSYSGSGNYLVLTDSAGWEYRYIHLNNDSPGTDDGANPRRWAFAPGLVEGSCVATGALVSYVGDSGNAEGSGSHLHFEIRRPDGLWINPYWSVKSAQEGNGLLLGELSLSKPQPYQLCRPRTAPAATPSAASAAGYWLLDSSGRVHAYGGAPHLGDLATDGVGVPPASMQATESGLGYWIVDEAGAVHPYGDAVDHGDMTGTALDGPVRRIEAHLSGAGYWLVADDGGVFSFGNAAFHGSMGGIALDGPVISMTSTATGSGYWLVADDGGVFSFGDAVFRGSTGDMELAAPVIDMAVHPSGNGYWLYAADGGVFTFGTPGFLGSAPGLGRCDLAPSISMRVSDTGRGYWLANTDGEVLPFGDAAWFGDRPPLDEHDTIVDMAVHHHPEDG